MKEKRIRQESSVGIRAEITHDMHERMWLEKLRRIRAGDPVTIEDLTIEALSEAYPPVQE